MRVAVLSSFDLDGGAARAAFRLHSGLKGLEVDSTMVVQRKWSDDPKVELPSSKLQQFFQRARPELDQIATWRYTSPKSLFSPAWVPDGVVARVRKLRPDIVNLHWITAGFLRIESLVKFTTPLVWTLHDMWAFTGGCHYDGGCERFSVGCGACPVLRSDRRDDLSRRVFRRKEAAWRNLNLVIVSPSQWLADCAKRSLLFGRARVEVIQNGIDLGVFKPIDRQVARQVYQLPAHKRIVLFGAVGASSDKRKGLDVLRTALARMAQQGHKDLMLVVFGASEGDAIPGFESATRYVGSLRDDVSLSVLYAAADVFVAPSFQDNLPNTVVEALACGVPCVAFRTGGMPEMIDHLSNGYLAEPFDPEDLANGIAWVVGDESRWCTLALRARDKAQACFRVERQAQNYLDLYKDLLDAEVKR